MSQPCEPVSRPSKRSAVIPALKCCGPWIRSGPLPVQVICRDAMIQMHKTFSWFLLMLANVLWASSYVAAKFALRDISVNMMNALRMIISALVLLPLLIALRKELNLTRRDLPQLALLAIVGIVIAKTLEFGGLALSTASDVALLISSESIFTAVLSWFLLGERFKPLTGFALLLGLLGVYLIVERSFV